MSRERWSSRTIFIFAAIGSAVGLGNVWRFPYLAYKFGGGAFLIPYILAFLVVGIPLLMLEFALGQKFQKGAVGAFSAIHPKFKGVGIGALFAGFIVITYYAVIMGWTVLFLINSFRAKLPWTGDSEGFFFNSVLGITDSVRDIGGINWMLIAALFVVWLSIYFIVRNGVKSVGKAVIVTMPLPVILLVVLFIRGITLPGALSGIVHFLKPDFSALLSTEIWLAAISQIFFSFSLAFGIMIAYSSFNKKNQDVAGDALITSTADIAISLFAGLVVFSIVGYMATATGVGVGEAVASGPGLAFVVFPEALSLMPFSWFFAVIFFLTLFSLGIDSAFSNTEAINTAIGDRWKRPNRPKIAFWVCTISFLVGIIFTTGAGYYLLDIVDHFITSFGLVAVGILECLVVGWVYGADNLRKDINKVGKFKIGKWWNVLIRYIIPALLTVLLIVQFIKDIMNPYEGYPALALLIGWITVIILALVIVYPILFGRKD